LQVKLSKQIAGQGKSRFAKRIALNVSFSGPVSSCSYSKCGQFYGTFPGSALNRRYRFQPPQIFWSLIQVDPDRSRKIQADMVPCLARGTHALHIYIRRQLHHEGM